MSADTVHEHHGYLTDARRIDAYRTGMAAAVRDGDSVLDLGCGTGLLGILALQAGAAHVDAVEAGPLIEVARSIARLNGHDDRITHHRCWSTELLVPPVDVVVCDQVDGVFGLEAGLLDTLPDALERLARPGAAVVPWAIEPVVAAVTYPRLRKLLADLDGQPAGLDVSPLAHHARNNVWYAPVADLAVGGSAPGDLLDLAALGTQPVEVTVQLAFDDDSEVDALGCCWRAHTGDSATFSNLPGSADVIGRGMSLLPVGLAVRAGETVEASVSIHPGAGIIRWRAAVAERVVARDTFAGVLLGPDDVRAADPSRPVRRTRSGSLLFELLGAVDGSRSIADLAALLDADHADLVPRRGGGGTAARSAVADGYLA